MEIAIRSECDSRVLLYPLIKTLYNYGTVAVYSSNRNLCRLIENELEGGFRNVRIVVNTEADLDEAKQSDDYFRDKYDFLIYDNMGAVDYDMLICIVTNKLSESYVSDLVYLAPMDKTHIIKFGTPAPLQKGEKPTKSAKPSKGSSQTGEEFDDDPTFNKWNVEKTDEQILQEMLDNKEYRWCRFPTFDAIEEMESRFKMIVPDDTLIRELYKLFGTILSIDERQFTKGARLADEGSSLISGTDVR